MGAILGKDAPKADQNQNPRINVDSIVDKGRADFIAAIAERNAEKRKDEFQPFDGDTITDSQADIGDDPAKQPTDDSPVDDPAKQPTDDSPADTDADKNAGNNDHQPDGAMDEMVTIKVDGEERQVPLAEIREAGIRTYQKSAAADKRLEEASKLLKEMQSERDAWKQSPSKPPEKTKGQIELESAQQRLVAASDRLIESQAYDGPEDIRKAFREYEAANAAVMEIKFRSEPNQPVDDIIKQEFARRDAERRQQNHQAIIKQLEMPAEKGGYEDLLKDKRAFALMSNEVDNLLQAGEPDVFETYQKAGNTIRDFLGIRADKQQEQDGKSASSDALAEKRKRKIETADNIKTTGAVHNPKSTAEKPMTREEIIRAGIAELRKARGQTATGF